MAGRKKKLSPEQMREYIHSLRGSLKQKPAKNPSCRSFWRNAGLKRKRKTVKFNLAHSR